MPRIELMRTTAGLRDMMTMNSTDHLDDQLALVAVDLAPSALYDYGTALYEATREYVSDYKRHEAGLIAVGAGAVVQFAVDAQELLGSDAGAPVAELKAMIDERFEQEL